MFHFDIENNAYGLNHLLRDYTKYPKWLPLPALYEHSPLILGDGVSDFDKISPLPIMLLHNERRNELWRLDSQKTSCVIGPLFIHYRKAHGIAKSKDATGTLAFFSHSTHIQDTSCDCGITDFCRDLNRLPEAYKPITVCVHWQDRLRGKEKIFQRNGFKVVCAGPNYGDAQFVKRFYEFLSQSSYVVSNEPGAYTLYAVEMGIPFFLVGNLPKRVVYFGTSNESQEDQTMLDHCDSTWGNFGGKDANEICNFDRRVYLVNLFNTGPSSTIAKEQDDFVAKELGIDDGITAKELKSVLLREFFKSSYMMRYTLRWYLSGIKRILLLNFAKQKLKHLITKNGYTIKKISKESGDSSDEISNYEKSAHYFDDEFLASSSYYKLDQALRMSLRAPSITGKIKQRLKNGVVSVARLFHVFWMKTLALLGFELSAFDPNQRYLRWHRQHGMRTMHNVSFLENSHFTKAYGKGMRLYDETEIKDYDLQWNYHIALWVAAQAKNRGEVYVACGVNRGAMAVAIMEYINWNQLDKKFYLIDSFCRPDLTLWNENEMKHGRLEYSKALSYNCIEAVKNEFNSFERVYFVQGKVPEVFSNVDLQNIGLLLVDMNRVREELITLEVLWDNIVPGGFVLLDNYGLVGHEIFQKELGSFAQKKGVEILTFPTGQGLLVKP